MADILDRKIIDTLRAARAFEQVSDEFFARGNPGKGAQYHRLAIETYARADALAKAQQHSLASHRGTQP